MEVVDIGDIFENRDITKVGAVANLIAVERPLPTSPLTKMLYPSP